MEYTLWEPDNYQQAQSEQSLNPYSNGIYSMRAGNHVCGVRMDHRLNPYSNGIYSMRVLQRRMVWRIRMRLNPYSNGIYSMSWFEES